MPTPQNGEALVLSPPAEHESPPSRATCPPEEVRIYTPRSDGTSGSVRSEILTDFNLTNTTQQPSPPPDDDCCSENRPTDPELTSKPTAEEDIVIRDAPSPISSMEDSTYSERRASQSTLATTVKQDIPASYLQNVLSHPATHPRYRPNSTSSYLRHGSKFRGTQKSDRQEYDVQVDIKYVDMEESFLCGYLRIQGLTDDHPTLTTYFEGEIIGTKYTFLTRHEEWGSSQKVDMQHWGRFPAWTPLAKQAKRPDFNFKNYTQHENIFMRWKEYFLVPDHRVRSINGASFEGFYYICFNQVSGTISGIYFHAKSEKYQQLELKHVPDNGCTTAIEFR